MSLRKLTRRQLAGAIVGTAPLLARNLQVKTQADPLKLAADERRDRIRALDEVKLPTAVEPAFVFRAL